MTKPLKPIKVRPRRMWALIDRKYPTIEASRIFDTRTTNGGRGSVTEGWVPVRVTVTPIRRRKR